MKVQTHRITRLVAIGLAAMALAAPAASAVPARPDATPADRVIIQPDVAPLVDDGFDWGSAAIGAGGAGALILLLSAGGFSYRHRQEHIRTAH
jgi:hypothetical protein